MFSIIEYDLIGMRQLSNYLRKIYSCVSVFKDFFRYKMKFILLYKNHLSFALSLIIIIPVGFYSNCSAISMEV
jgi:hypothetical protein